MSSISKTLIFVGSAIALAALAAVSSPGGKELPFFDDVGEEFFPDFKEPSKAAELEVWEFNAKTGEASAFDVKSEKGYWTIPSHHNYPADGKARMAKAAGLLIDLTKDGFKSDRVEDHAGYGVVDPKAPDLDLEGRGMRVSIKDANGSILGDLIVGKEVPNHSGQRYVRLPGKKRTYTAKIDLNLSTKFEDWIERDLLKASSYDLSHITFDNYSVDETRGVKVSGEKIELDKEGTDWVVEGMSEDEEVHRDVIDGVTGAITGLKIVGVRPKPKGLTATLEQARGFTREILMSQLASRGYFLASDGKLYSNEGDLMVKTKKGVVYTLKFGEVVPGSGDELTAGSDAETVKVDNAGSGADIQADAASQGAHRYLMVTAAFDESLLDRPDGEALPQEHLDKLKTARGEIEKLLKALESYKGKKSEYPDALSDLTSGDEQFIGSIPKDPWNRDFAYEKHDDGIVVVCTSADGAVGGEGVNADLRSDAFEKLDDLQESADKFKSYENEVADGQEEAKKLSDRFGDWYYVIDAESFGKLRVGRRGLVGKKKVDAPTPEAGK